MAGGVALNCVANTRLAAEGPFDELWVPPAAGDAGTALHLAQQLGDQITPMPGADLGRGFTARWLDDAHLRYERPPDVAAAAAEALVDDAIVAWFQGRSEFGPRTGSPVVAREPRAGPEPRPSQMRSRAASSSGVNVTVALRRTVGSRQHRLHHLDGLREGQGRRGGHRCIEHDHHPPDHPALMLYLFSDKP